MLALAAFALAGCNTEVPASRTTPPPVDAPSGSVPESGTLTGFPTAAPTGGPVPDPATGPVPGGGQAPSSDEFSGDLGEIG